MWTYDNAQFHKFLIIFFILGFILNGTFGFYTMNYGYIFNSIMLGILAFCCYKLHKIYVNIKPLY